MTRNRLIGDGMTPKRPDAWIAEWVAQAARRRLDRGSAYWEAAWHWIAAERRLRSRPQTKTESPVADGPSDGPARRD
ncbi:MAG TPA: hypothetical protein VFO73_04480 [Candidatus Limnocylindrales bacterium]|nr:hypothetical protein [Candidatus Limnocylindrales bacterium]